MSSQEYEFKTFNEKPKQTKVLPLSQESKVKEARLTLVALYMIAAVFLIPQFFEKKIIKIDVVGTKYLFPEITEFGKSRWVSKITDGTKAVATFLKTQ